MKKSLKLFIVLILLISNIGCSKTDETIYSGSVEASKFDINSEVSGKVTEILKREGDSVKAGEIIAVVDNSIQKLAVKQSELQVDMKQLKYDEIEKNSKSEQQENLLKISEKELEIAKNALEQSKLILDKYKIKAPVDGIFLRQNIQNGDMINAGTNIGEILKSQDLWVNIYVPQKYLNKINLGSNAYLKCSAVSNNYEIKGEIIFISDQAEFTPKNVESTEDKENTVYRVKIKIIDHIDLLKSGMSVNVKLQ